jgi:hypothetical protein
MSKTGCSKKIILTLELVNENPLQIWLYATITIVILIIIIIMVAMISNQ